MVPCLLVGLVRIFVKETRPTSKYHRVHHEAVLVYEIVLHQRAEQLPALGNQEVLTRLPLQLGDLFRYSCFLRDVDCVFYNYSAFGPGAEMVGGANYFLDLTALGRQEEWEEPKGRAAGAGASVPDFSS